MRMHVVATILLLAIAVPRETAAQDLAPVFGNGPIPDKPYTSWSLFLQCNPEWLLDKQDAALRDVFAAYRAFGRTTGGRHAAVWFVKSESSVAAAVAENPKNLDIERNVAYCRRFGLLGSEGPHIVVTTVHPDRWKRGTGASSPDGDPIIVLALGEKSAADVVGLLKRLNDQVLAENLSQKELASESYWQSWARIVDGVCRFFDKVKVTIDVKFLSIERTGVCN